MIGNILQEITTQLENLNELFIQAVTVHLDEAHRSGNEVEVARLLNNCMRRTNRLQADIGPLAKRYKNRIDNVKITTDKKLLPLLEARTDLVKYQHQLHAIFKNYFGGIFSLSRLDFLDRMLDAVYYETPSSAFRRVDKLAKPFAVTMIAFAFLQAGGAGQNKIVLKGKLICVVLPQINILINLEKNITYKGQVTSDNITWIKDVIFHIQQYIGLGVLIPSSFEGIEFV